MWRSQPEGPLFLLAPGQLAMLSSRFEGSTNGDEAIFLDLVGVHGQLRIVIHRLVIV